MNVSVGDFVRVVNNHTGHGFKIGEICIVARVFENGNYYEAVTINATWYLASDEFEKFEF